MAAEVLNKRSDQVQASGIPAVPLASQLKYGEFAVNYSDGAETLFIKNNNDEVVSFSNDEALIAYMNNTYYSKELSGNAKIFYGTCSTAAGTADKSVTCPEFTSSDLVAGALIFVKFSATNSAEVANLRLDINSTGWKSIKKQYTNVAAQNLNTAGELIANRSYLFTYDGTYWICMTLDYNSNTTYSVISDSELRTGTATSSRVITAARLKANYNINGQTINIAGNSVIVPTISVVQDILDSRSGITINDSTTYLIEGTEPSGSSQATIAPTWGALNSKVTLSNSYQQSSDLNDDLFLEAGDTFEEAFGKIEKRINDNELIVSSALINLNNGIIDVNTELDLVKDHVENSEEVIARALNDLNNDINLITEHIENSDLTVTSALNDLNQNISEKQNIIDSSNKLSADLISNGITNKVYTDAEQSKLSGIESGAEVNEIETLSINSTNVIGYLKNLRIEFEDGIFSSENINTGSVMAHTEVTLKTKRTSGNVRHNITGILATDSLDLEEEWAMSGDSAIPTVGLVKAKIDLKAPLVSPALTGTPTAPTATTGTSTTQIATTEFVDNSLSELADVATSGSYNDLNNKPDIPQYVICTLNSYNAMASHDPDTYYIILANGEEV